MEVCVREDVIERFNEWRLCSQDIVYFAEKHLGIVLYGYQKELLRCFVSDKPIVVNKSRQLGITTTFKIYATWMMLFHREKNISYFSHSSGASKSFLRNVVKSYNSVPEWMKLGGLFKDNRNECQTSQGVCINALSSHEQAPFHSMECDIIIFDEAAFIQGFESLLLTAQMQSHRIFIASTPDFPGSKFCDFWNDACSGKNAYRPIILPWYVNPKQDAEWAARVTSKMTPTSFHNEYLCEFANR